MIIELNLMVLTIDMWLLTDVSIYIIYILKKKIEKNYVTIPVEKYQPLYSHHLLLCKMFKNV